MSESARSKHLTLGRQAALRFDLATGTVVVSDTRQAHAPGERRMP